MKIIFIILTIFFISCGTLDKNSDSYKIKRIQNSYWVQKKGDEKNYFKKGKYETHYKIDDQPCVSCKEKAQLGDIVLGNLTGKDTPDAVAIVFLETGGSGTFVYLNLYTEKKGEMVQSGFPIYIGDRVKIKSVSIVKKKVLIEMITHDKKDPYCCPTKKQVLEFRVKNGQLKEIRK